MTAKQDVTRVMHGGDGDAGFMQQVIRIISRRTPERIENYLESGFAYERQINDLFEPRKVVRLGIDGFRCCLGCWRSDTGVFAVLWHQRLDGLSHFRKRRGAVWRGKFDAVIFRRIVGG